MMPVDQRWTLKINVVRSSYYIIFIFSPKPWLGPRPCQGQAVFAGFGLAQTLRKPKPPWAKPGQANHY